MSKVLFLCKENYSYGSEKGTFHGLVNSAHFITNSLVSRHVDAVVKSVVDADEIDSVVQAENPSMVVIEALWVTPEKMSALMAMPEHQDRLWVVRIHSKAAFLAQEGVALEWIKSYPDAVVVCPNTRGLTRDLRTLGVEVMYLPNIYNPEPYETAAYNRVHDDDELNIGCFGALRPLKNHLNQAIAAISFADKLGMPMKFHVNDTNGNVENASVLQNLEAAFAGTKHELITHSWTSHREFIDLVQTMDMGMQVSLSESFNLVAADFVNNHVPIVVSDEIGWLPRTCKVSATADSGEIARMMEYVWKYFYPGIDQKSFKALDRYNGNARAAWWRIVKRLR